MSDLRELIAAYEQKVKNAGAPRDHTGDYEEIMKSIAGAYSASHQGREAMLKSEAKALENAYRSERGSEYASSRKRAALANEQLASAGLARALKDEASSGVSEMSRVKLDADMLNSISALNVKEQTGKRQIEDEILTSKYESELKTADALSELELQRLSAEQSASQFARQYDLDMYNALLAAYSQQLQQEQAAREFAYAQQQAAMSRAYSELNTFGRIISGEAAGAMGVAVGTTKKQLQKK